MSTYAYDENEDMPIVVLQNSDPNNRKPVNVRIHSECMTGDLFGSQRCDCGEQLDYSMQYISQLGGIIIYLRQEGRGIGLINKLKAYNKQDQGMNTLDANIALGFHADDRSYDEAIIILKELGVKEVNLLTNNPEKILSFEGTGIVVNKRIPVIVQPGQENIGYLKTKKESFGHLL